MASSNGSRSLFGANNSDRQPLLSEDGSGSGNASSSLKLHAMLFDYVVTEFLACEHANAQIKQANAQIKIKQANAPMREEIKKKKNIDKVVANALQGNTAKRAAQLFTNQSGVSDELKKPNGPESFFLFKLGTFNDFSITFLRSYWQVLSDVIASGSNANDNRSDSHFNRTIYQRNGDPASGLTLAGTLSLVASLGSFGVAAGIAIYQILHKQWLASFDYFAQQVKKISPEAGKKELLEAKLEKGLKKALSENRLSVFSILSSRSEWDADFKPNGFTGLINNLFNTKVARVISTAWGRLSSYAYIFWLAWFPFALKFGLDAANGVALAPGGVMLVPIILAITLIAGTALNVAEIFVRKSAEEPAKTKAQAVAEGELQRLEHEAKLLAFIKSEHGAIRNSLGLKMNVKKLQPKKLDGIVSDSQLTLIKRRLLGSVHERRARVAVGGLLGFLSGVLTLIFIAWLSSSIIGFFGLGVAAGFIGGYALGGIGGVVSGILSAVSVGAEMHAKQLEYEQKVNDILTAKYRNTDESKGAAFERLYQEVERRKASLKNLNDPAVQAYLKKVDVFNDRYFEKFEHEAGAFTWIKKGLSRAHVFLFGSQTGAFAARFFLLKGSVLAGALGFSIFAAGAAAFWPFIIAATALAVVVGVLGVVRYQMESNRQHRENFLNTLDSRIYYLEKKNQELCELQYVNSDKLGLDKSQLFANDSPEQSEQSNLLERSLERSDGYNRLDADERGDSETLDSEKSLVSQERKFPGESGVAKLGVFAPSSATGGNDREARAVNDEVSAEFPYKAS